MLSGHYLLNVLLVTPVFILTTLNVDVGSVVSKEQQNIQNRKNLVAAIVFVQYCFTCVSASV